MCLRHVDMKSEYFLVTFCNNTGQHITTKMKHDSVSDRKISPLDYD
jgi:hypothetical protein